MNLDDWNKQFGGDSGIDPFKPRRANAFEYELQVAYPIRIRRATVVTSQRGDVQLKLNLSVQKDDTDEAEEIGQSVEFITIPFQQNDLNLPRDKVEGITQRRMDNVKRIFSVAAPADYAPYASVESDPERPGRKIYKDFDDVPLVNGMYDERQRDIQKRLMEKVRHMHDNTGATVDLLADALLYVVKVENPKDERYPYTNFYALRPAKFPLVSEKAEAPF